MRLICVIMIRSHTLENNVRVWNRDECQSVHATVLRRLRLKSRQGLDPADQSTAFRVYAMKPQHIFVWRAVPPCVCIYACNRNFCAKRDAAILVTTLAAVVARPTLHCRVHDEAIATNNCITHVQNQIYALLVCALYIVSLYTFLH